MPEKRDIVKCVVLSIVTVGLYWIYWTIKLGKEAISVKDETDTGTKEIVCMIFLPFLGLYLAEKKFYDGCQNKGYNKKKDLSVFYLVAGVFWLSAIAIMQDDMNKYVDALSMGFVPAAGATAIDAANSGIPSVGVNKPTQDQIVKELQMYKELCNQGVLTQEEFDAKKQQLLGMM